MLENPNNLDLSNLKKWQLEYLNDNNTVIETIDDDFNVNCEYCTNCEGCIGCADCSWCIVCIDCYGCIDCIECTRCVNCTLHKECDGCIGEV